MSDYSQTAPARLATRLAFLAAGFAIACLAPLFPFIKSAVGADEGQFGALLLCLGFGSLIAMPVTGIVAAQRGAKPMVLLGGFGMASVLPLLVLAQAQWQLGAALFVFGASLGTIDVAMNVHGAEVEATEKRPLMSNFHAQFRIGGFLGAGLMTLLLIGGLSYVWAGIIGALVTVATMIGTVPRLLRARGGPPVPFTWPRGVVLLLALLAGITFLIEGAILDWGALLLIDLQVTSSQSAGLGYIIFSVAMVIARLTGDQVVSMAGPLRVLIAGGCAAILGIALVLLAPHAGLALSGFALIGLGAANLVPVVFSAAGRQTVMPPSLALASVTTTGYAGILIGPAMIGAAADRTDLPTAFWLLAALMVLVPLTARRVARI